MTYQAQIVGTYAQESETFQWGWANESLEPTTTRAIAAVRNTALTEHGLSALLRPTLPCGDGLAWTLVRLASVRMGAHGIYPASYGEGTIFFAVME